MSSLDALNKRIDKTIAEIEQQIEQAALPDITILEQAWLHEEITRKFEAFQTPGLTIEDKCLLALQIQQDIDARKTPQERAAEQRRNAQLRFSCVGAKEQLLQRLDQIRASSEGISA